MAQKGIFITGVSSGIGLGLAREYLDQGLDVYGVSRRDPADLGESLGDSFHFAAVDLTDEKNARTIIQDLLKGVDMIEAAVLNAGVLGEIKDMKDCTLNELRDTMDINVWANKTVIDALIDLPVTIQQIVTISSGAAVNGNRGWNGYSISKAALNMMTTLYAREYDKTHFSAIAPGLVDTAMQDHLCGLPDDSRYASLDVLKSKRGTDEMPTAEELAPRLINFFKLIKGTTPSGEFIDIRTVAMEQICDARR